VSAIVYINILLIFASIIDLFPCVRKAYAICSLEPADNPEETLIAVVRTEIVCGHAFIHQVDDLDILASAYKAIHTLFYGKASIYSFPLK
jgi:hypothetical protein